MRLGAAVVDRWRLIATTLVFDLFWLIAVIGRDPWWPVLLASLLLLWAWQPGLIARAWPLALAGGLMDGLWVVSGLFVFESPGMPWWLVALWLGFASYLSLVRQWLAGWSALTLIIAAAIGGPASYWAGVQLGAVNWPLGPGITLALLAVAWVGYGGFACWSLRRSLGASTSAC